jgi:flagellar biosynthesis/type III secretory pathway M-ring protein FliF/YscJ
MLLQIPVPPAPPVPPPFPSPEIFHGPFFPPPWVTLPPAVVMLSVIAICTAVAVVLFPVMRALARRIEGRRQDPAMEQELDDLRGRVHELEAAQGRFAELEERLDFAERLLTRRPDSEQLPRN